MPGRPEMGAQLGIFLVALVTTDGVTGGVATVFSSPGTSGPWRGGCWLSGRSDIQVPCFHLARRPWTVRANAFCRPRSFPKNPLGQFIRGSSDSILCCSGPMLVTWGPQRFLLLDVVPFSSSAPCFLPQALPGPGLPSSLALAHAALAFSPAFLLTWPGWRSPPGLGWKAR